MKCCFLVARPMLVGYWSQLHGVKSPLANGATRFCFEGVPTYPDSRSILGLSGWIVWCDHSFILHQTATELLMAKGDEATRSSSVILYAISVGQCREPINPEAVVLVFLY